MCRRRKDRERRIGGGREEEERKKQTVRREIKETDNMNEYIISFLDLFLQCIYHFQYNITVVLVPDPRPIPGQLLFSITHTLLLSCKDFNCGFHPHHEWCVVSQGKQSQPKTMQDVDHPRYTGRLSKRHQPHSLIIQNSLVVDKTNALGKDKEGV